ncbi:MAG: HDIG domain-containing protein [Mycoplasmataceae bacterium]|jgi:ribonuclease Y|nr:HDIG domain-containing protein [Mycoplasmataceae bacterium]
MFKKIKSIKIKREAKRTSFLNNQLIEKNKILDQKIKEYETKLETVSGLKSEDIRNELTALIDKELLSYKNKQINDITNEVKENSSKISHEILLNTMESMAESIAKDKTTYVVDLPPAIAEAFKSKIIGRSGSAIKEFESLTGVDLIISEKGNPTLTISSFNPIRRHLAKEVLEQLAAARNVDIVAIKAVYAQKVKEQEERFIEIGRDTIENKLQIPNISSDLYPIIGRLSLRTSYGQNVLSHSIETAKICKLIAGELGLDQSIALKVGFFHDIGKAVDFENDNDHVEQGKEIAKKYKLGEYVYDGIATHHNYDKPQFIYSSIIKVADIISAGRPGSRIEHSGNLFQRNKEMEKICTEIPGVEKAFVLRSGKNLMVYVEPSKISDSELNQLAYSIKQKLNDNQNTRTANPEISIIRTTTFTHK